LPQYSRQLKKVAFAAFSISGAQMLSVVGVNRLLRSTGKNGQN